MEKKIGTFYPKTKRQWRKWLEKNHLEKDAVWVIFYKKGSGQPTISWSEAVDEALCFGWIDSVKKKLDDERSIQFFSKRKPKSTWSKINKDKIQVLIDNGLMAQAGYECIAAAKLNGSWIMLDEVENLTIPADLEEAFETNPGAREHFQRLSKTLKKILLQSLVFARRSETRQKRISEIMTRYCS